MDVEPPFECLKAVQSLCGEGSGRWIAQCDRCCQMVHRRPSKIRSKPTHRIASTSVLPPLGARRVVDSRAPMFQLLWAGRYSSLFNFATIFHSRSPLSLDLCCNLTICFLFPYCTLGIVDRWNFKCVNCLEQVATARSSLPEQFVTICNVRTPLSLYLCYNLTTCVLFPHCNYEIAIRCAPLSISSSSNYFEQVATAQRSLWRFAYTEPVVIRFILQFDYLCLSSHCIRGDADLKLVVYSCDVGTVRWFWIMTSR